MGQQSFAFCIDVDKPVSSPAVWANEVQSETVDVGGRVLRSDFRVTADADPHRRTKLVCAFPSLAQSDIWLTKRAALVLDSSLLSQPDLLAQNCPTERQILAGWVLILAATASYRKVSANRT